MQSVYSRQTCLQSFCFEKQTNANRVCVYDLNIKNIYSESIPPSLPALRDSVWMNKLIRKSTGRRVPRATAMYAPNWTSRAREVVGIASTIESRAKAGATMEATGREPAATAPTAFVTVESEKRDSLVSRVFRQILSLTTECVTNLEPIDLAQMPMS